MIRTVIFKQIILNMSYQYCTESLAYDSKKGNPFLLKQI